MRGSGGNSRAWDALLEHQGRLADPLLGDYEHTAGAIRRGLAEIGSLQQRVNELRLDVNLMAQPVAISVRLAACHQLHDRRDIVLDPLPPGQRARSQGKRVPRDRARVGDQPALVEPQRPRG